MTSLGSRFATAVATKDAAGVRALVSDDVDFKGLTPRRLWEGSSPDELVTVLGTWFGTDDHIDELVEVVDGDPIADTHHVAYRLRITTPDGPHAVAQQAYYRADGDRITYLRVMCSGFRPIG
ncbi:hypothetical protein [Nocardioides sp. SR21]|uniref:hypothetical protein n=1 Tax=Nocardioides sp. SR21 TaxID=2919501 RepID=UPI001FA9D8F4|nr:hypothetical protein [Nocardioides sp. SR21]